MHCCCDTSGHGLKQTLEHALQIVTVSREGCTDYFITGRLGKGESAQALYQGLAEQVRKLCATMVCLEVFGRPGDEEAAAREAFSDAAFPILWLEEGCENAEPLCGVQAWAVTGPQVEPLFAGGRCIGSLFEVNGVQYCRLGGLVPADVSGSRSEQTRSVFESMERALAEAGMGFANVLRTWFYNFKMLDWYDDFNVVRTAYFKEHGVFDGLVPASTGIGGRNAAGAALTAGLVAAKAKQGAMSAIAVPSPLQCSALNYGSSFSRAVEFASNGVRRLYISGTASIEPGGRSVHIGDVEKQIELTMDVARAILTSRGMDWCDVSRAITYFKHYADAPAFTRYCAARGVEGLPMLYTNNDICRDDLLFEIELDAVSTTELNSN